MADGDLRIVFDDLGDFTAANRAVNFLEAAGFAVGEMQANEPRGILYEGGTIGKWRTLDNEDRFDLDGVITGDQRNGPVVVLVFAKAPARARDAILQAQAQEAAHA